jgi:hypothetical protein
MSFAQRRNQRIKLVIPLLIVIVGVAVVGSQITTAQSPTARPIAGAPSSPNLADPAQATVRFMQAYYTADYRQRDQWLAALKPLASTDGYTLLENMLAPALWPNLEKTQTVVAADQVTVEDRGLKVEGVSKLTGNTAWQIRGVVVTLARAVKWPDMPTNTHATNVLLSQENGVWKFVMLLSDDQIKLFQAHPKEAK